MKGTIKWYNIRKGYGFIQGEDGEDYFVHYSAVPEGLLLRENNEVEFEAVDTDKGKQAQKVTKTGEGKPVEEKEEETTEEKQEEAPAEEEAKEKEAPAEETPQKEAKE